MQKINHSVIVVDKKKKKEAVNAIKLFMQKKLKAEDKASQRRSSLTARKSSRITGLLSNIFNDNKDQTEKSQNSDKIIEDTEHIF